MSTTDASMAGRVCLITGANTGIGRATAIAMAKRGAELVLACRSRDKAQPVIDEINGLDSAAKTDVIELDLASLASVRRAAADFIALDRPLHVLINNAGLAGKHGLTEDGFELTFGVNHLGHFLLTELLLDKLKESAPARIVNVASKAHYQATGIDYTTLREATKTVTGLPEYQVSKLANVLFTAELHRRLEGTDVTTYSLHPGVVASDVWRNVPWPFRSLIKLFMISNEEGAATSVHCATAPGLKSGRYYDECKRIDENPIGQDAKIAAELWEKSEAWTREAAAS